MMPPPPPPPGQVADVAIVRRLDQESPRYFKVWEPYIARWRDDLIVAFGKGLAGKSDMGDIVCSRRSDRGASWSEAVAIVDSDVALGGLRYAYANPVLYRPPGQNLVWCFAIRCPSFYPDSEDSRLCAAYSVDGGLSWQPVELAVELHSPMMIVAGIFDLQIGGRTRYLLPAQRNTMYHDPRGDHQHLVLESDNLLEWKLAGYVPQAETARVLRHEGNIPYGGVPGDLEMVMRTALLSDMSKPLDPPTAYSSVSRDGGHTWSLARAEPRLYNAVSKAFYGRDSTGRHIYVYNDGPGRERRALRYMVQSPSGEWSIPRTFFDANTQNSYPTLLEESPGQFLCVWDSSTDSSHHRTAIRFGRLKLP